jgi:hypothetical protein
LLCAGVADRRIASGARFGRSLGLEDADGTFTNVVITTPVVPPPPAPPLGAVDFSSHTVVSYGAGQDAGSYVVADGGFSLKLEGNAWKRITLPTDVTAGTVLEFDYSSTVEGEIHGIGFDTNDSVSANWTFQLFGTQTWGLQDYATYVSPGWTHYTIPVGTFYTGSFDYLFFANDDGAAAADGTFTDVVITTPDPEPPAELPEAPALVTGAVDFTGLEVTPYGLKPFPQDLSGGAAVVDAGRTFVLSGNTWKKVPLATEIAADTVLEFDFYGFVEGEIQGLGFDSDDAYSQNVTFEIAGTTTWGIQDSHDPVGTAWVHCTIPIGESYTGSFDYLFFVNDHDGAPSDAESLFTNVTITP